MSHQASYETTRRALDLLHRFWLDQTGGPPEHEGDWVEQSRTRHELLQVAAELADEHQAASEVPYTFELEEAERLGLGFELSDLADAAWQARDALMGSDPRIVRLRGAIGTLMERLEIERRALEDYQAGREER